MGCAAPRQEQIQRCHLARPVNSVTFHASLLHQAGLPIIFEFRARHDFSVRLSSQGSISGPVRPSGLTPITLDAAGNSVFMRGNQYE